MRGPLHGIPVLIKDNIDTADAMKTTAGSLALADAPVPKEDAFIVKRLREAGALILGKTNLSEWANLRSTRSSSGWSGRGGQTRNPYALDRSPSGSSSGSGAAVAASLCAVAVGTETDGSVVSPANANGLVGLKPTVGLVSRSGIIPISHTQDTAGPMTRTVRDAAILLGVLAGSDPKDAATREADARREADYTRFLVKDGLQGVRLGVVKNLFGVHAHVDAVIRPALEVLKARGATLVEVELKSASYEDAEFEVLLYEFKADLNAYLAGRGGPVKDLAGLMAFNEAHREEEMPFFGQELLQQAQAKGPLTDPAYLKALETCAQARRDITGLLEKHAIAGPGGAHRRTRLAHRPCQRRQFRPQLLHTCRGRRLPAHHGARGLCLRAAPGALLRGGPLAGGPSCCNWPMPSNRPPWRGAHPSSPLPPQSVRPPDKFLSTSRKRAPPGARFLEQGLRPIF